eukprot:CAMPEP_0114236138 /NCGR_PEP_ID=MMETSP0058-20121206/6664_1 /TAXON_ID=36894 /ORGANISM="Pyramimonas parkeae, CCMP726" /LENGTH=289 /DNA_ID=CAMNT_0001348027 /DNA_START=528 /DNA_END=1397 /DNA_ORIENTATION=+
MTMRVQAHQNQFNERARSAATASISGVGSSFSSAFETSCTKQPLLCSTGLTTSCVDMKSTHSMHIDKSMVTPIKKNQLRVLALLNCANQRLKRECFIDEMDVRTVETDSKSPPLHLEGACSVLRPCIPASEVMVQKVNLDDKLNRECQTSAPGTLGIEGHFRRALGWGLQTSSVLSCSSGNPGIESCDISHKRRRVGGFRCCSMGDGSSDGVPGFMNPSYGDERERLSVDDNKRPRPFGQGESGTRDIKSLQVSETTPLPCWINCMAYDEMMLDNDESRDDALLPEWVR